MREEPIAPPKLSRRRKRGLTNQNKTFMDVQRCKRAMFLFDTGCTTKHIMRDLQISEKSVRKFKNQYEFTGTIQPTFGMFKKPIRSQRQVMETIAAKEALTKLVRQNCSLTLGAMKQALQKLGIKRQAATIHKYLKQLRYSRKKIRKVPIERNTKEKLIFRQKYCRMISQIPLQNLVFLDQTSFHQHTSQNFGWAPKGQYAAIHLPAHKKQVVTLLAAISIKGFQATKIIRGPITCKHITEFIEHYLDHLEPHEVLIMDNARVHHAAPVKQKIAQLKRPVRFLPAYTPQLNPIQSVFGQIKNQFKKRRNHATMKITEVEELIQESVQNLKSKNFKTYYEHYTQWVKKGIAGQLFI